ncbi:unnamed protein product [Caretta caretta]
MPGIKWDAEIEDLYTVVVYYIESFKVPINQQRIIVEVMFYVLTVVMIKKEIQGLQHTDAVYGVCRS